MLTVPVVDCPKQEAAATTNVVMSKISLIESLVVWGIQVVLEEE
jgi:hypothetical protein